MLVWGRPNSHIEDNSQATGISSISSAQEPRAENCQLRTSTSAEGGAYIDRPGSPPGTSSGSLTLQELHKKRSVTTLRSYVPSSTVRGISMRLTSAWRTSYGGSSYP